MSPITEKILARKEFDLAHDCAERIYLTGFMGSGKTTVARELAQILDFACIDLDDAIERKQGMTIKEIFDTRGERAFRAIESTALKETVNTTNSVISTGGGIVLSDENRAMLNRLGAVVYLQVSAEEAIARIGDVDSRPLLSNSSAVVAATSLLAARKSLYRAVADISIDTMGKTPEEIAHEIESQVKVCR